MKFQISNFKLRYLFLIALFLILSEIILRLIGFGDPILYENEKNYYPKYNQDIFRFKKSKVVINNHGMRTNHNWNNKINSKEKDELAGKKKWHEKMRCFFKSFMWNILVKFHDSAH